MSCDVSNSEPEKVNLPESGGTFPAAEEKLQQMEKEYALLLEKYELLQRRSIVEKICCESGCSDPEYLEFSAARRGVDLSNPDALREFVREFSANAPGCFHARITPGSSAGSVVKSDSPVSGAGERITLDRIGEIALSISGAPDASGR